MNGDAEDFLFRRLETLPLTQGRFKLNARLPIPFTGAEDVEVDLVDQRFGSLVLQFLAGDVSYRLNDILATSAALLALPYPGTLNLSVAGRGAAKDIPFAEGGKKVKSLPVFFEARYFFRGDFKPVGGRRVCDVRVEASARDQLIRHARAQLRSPPRAATVRNLARDV